jgi:hypothetical protein
MNIPTSVLESLVFIKIDNNNLLTGLSEQLGEEGNDFNVIFLESGIVTTKERSLEIEATLKYIKLSLSDQTTHEGTLIQ